VLDAMLGCVSVQGGALKRNAAGGFDDSTHFARVDFLPKRRTRGASDGFIHECTAHIVASSVQEK
jgi:hypothetical protein